MILTDKENIRFYNSTLDEITEALEQKDISNFQNVHISKEMSLNKDIVEFVCQCFPFKKIVVDAQVDDYQLRSKRVLFDEEETKAFVENVNMVRQKYSKDVVIDNDYSVETALEASRRINTTITTIKNMRVNGKELSPLEKYMCAYQYASAFHYKNTDDMNEPRDLISVLTGDKIVCVGFARVLKELCAGLDIPCALQHVQVRDSKGKINGHMNNSVYIDDKKYGVKGIYYADPCWDSLQGEATIPTILYALMKYSDIQKLYGNQIMFVTDDVERRDILFAESINKIEQKGAEITDEALAILHGKKDLFVNLVDDMVIDSICHNVTENKAKQQERTLNVLMKSKLNNLSEELFKNIAIYNYTSEKSRKRLDNIVTEFAQHGWTGDEIRLQLKQTMQDYEPSRDVAEAFAQVDHRFDEKMIEMLENRYYKTQEIFVNYSYAKDHATTIGIETILDVFKAIIQSDRMSKDDKKTFIENVLNNSVYHALQSFELKDDVDNPIVKLAVDYKNGEFDHENTDEQSKQK